MLWLLLMVMMKRINIAVIATIAIVTIDIEGAIHENRIIVATDVISIEQTSSSSSSSSPDGCFFIQNQ